MANGLVGSRTGLQALSLTDDEHQSGNLTIQTPDNVTLVLNFGGQHKPLTVTSSFNGRSASKKEVISKSPSLGSNDSNGSAASPSSTDSSEPSSPDLGANRAKAASKQIKVIDSITQPAPKPYRIPDSQAPSRESLKKFMDKHGSQVHATISLDQGFQESPYSTKWYRKRHYLSFNKHHSIRDVKFDGDRNIILTSRHSVQLYDGNGHFLERLYTDKVQEPWGLFVSSNTGNVFVSDHKEDCVKEFNHIGILMQEYGPVPSPCGVTVSNSDFLFVCSKTESCVFVFNKQGNLLKKIGEGTLTSPSYITIHEGNVLVSEEARVIAFTPDNQIDYVYGYADKSKHPACLCVDNGTGYVLASAYYKEGVIALKKDSRRATLVKEAQRPILCAVSPYGHLLVGERQQKGVLFKMYRAGKE